MSMCSSYYRNILHLYKWGGGGGGGGGGISDICADPAAGREDQRIGSLNVPFLKMTFIAVSGSSSFAYLAGK